MRAPLTPLLYENPRPDTHARGLTGGLFTSQYVCSWHAMTSLSPFLRCLAALGMEVEVGGRGAHNSPSHTTPTLRQSQVGSQAWAVPPRREQGKLLPQLLPSLHHHQVPGVADLPVQLVIVLLGDVEDAGG